MQEDGSIEQCSCDCEEKANMIRKVIRRINGGWIDRARDGSYRIISFIHPIFTYAYSKSWMLYHNLISAFYGLECDIGKDIIRLIAVIKQNDKSKQKIVN